MNSRSSKIIVDNIIAKIENGQLISGDKIDSERLLSKDLQVSRSTIREAIRQLNALGYLETINKVGTFVSTKYLEDIDNKKNFKDFIKLAPIFDLMEVRYILESNFIELAVLRADEKDIVQLQEILEKIKTENINYFDYYKYDLDFHFQIAKSTHNVVIVELMKVIINRIKSNEEYFVASGKQTMLDDIKIFELIIKNIKNRNILDAKHLYNKHLSKVIDSLRDV